jgi:hypothetical protein
MHTLNFVSPLLPRQTQTDSKRVKAAPQITLWERRARDPLKLQPGSAGRDRVSSPDMRTSLKNVIPQQKFLYIAGTFGGETYGTDVPCQQYLTATHP